MSNTTTIEPVRQAGIADAAIGQPSGAQADLDVAAILEDIEREITGGQAAGRHSGTDAEPSAGAAGDWEPSEEDWRDMYNWCEWIDLKEMEARCTDEDIRILHGCVG